MDWLGIGVFIIGIALFILVIILIKPLLKLSTVLSSVQQTTDRLPKVLDDNAKEANIAFKQVNETLENVNEQIHAVHPFFEIVEDAGLAARQVSSKWLKKSAALKENTAEAHTFTEEQKYTGFYGFLSFIFYLTQNKDVLAKVEQLKNKK